MIGIFRKKKAQEPDGGAMFASLMTTLSQIKRQGDTNLLELQKISQYNCDIRAALGLFMDRQSHALGTMEKFFKAQVELTEKQLKAVEELTPTEHDKVF